VSGEEALTVMVETHFPGPEVLNEEDTAQRSFPGVLIKGPGTGHWLDR
jgi:hypothetical protein